MDDAVKLLNGILENSEPGDTICLPLCEARQIARLSFRELGGLADAIAEVGAQRALESEGFFSRSVVIAPDGVTHFIVHAQGEPLRLEAK